MSHGTAENSLVYSVRWDQSQSFLTVLCAPLGSSDCRNWQKIVKRGKKAFGEDVFLFEGPLASSPLLPPSCSRSVTNQCTGRNCHSAAQWNRCYECPAWASRVSSHANCNRSPLSGPPAQIKIHPHAWKAKAAHTTATGLSPALQCPLRPQQMLPWPLTLQPPKNTFVTAGRPPLPSLPSLLTRQPPDPPPLRWSAICHSRGDFIGQHKQQHCAATKCHRCGKCYVNDLEQHTHSERRCELCTFLCVFT